MKKSLFLILSGCLFFLSAKDCSIFLKQRQELSKNLKPVQQATYERLEATDRSGKEKEVINYQINMANMYSWGINHYSNKEKEIFEKISELFKQERSCLYD